MDAPGQPVRDRTSTAREVWTIGPPALVLGGLLVAAILGDAYPIETLRTLLAVAFFQLLPGALLWRLVRPVDGWLVEDLTMGLAIGVALAVPFQVATVISGLPWIAHLLPLGLIAVFLGVPRFRARILARRWSPLPWWWSISLAGPLAVGVVTYLGSYRFPVRWVGYGRRYVDRGFHEGLVGELLHRFPLHYPWVADEEVVYHWFSHAWNANVAALSGSPIDVTLWLVSPAVISVAAPLLLAVVAVRITGRAWAGPVAATVGYLATTLEPWHSNGHIFPLLVESPSQMLAALVFPALLAVLALRWMGVLARGSLLLLTFLLVIAAGIKGTTLAVLVPGVLLAGAASLLFGRRRLRVVLVDAVVTLGVFLFTTVVIFHGETKNIEVAPFEWMARRTGAGLGVETATWSSQGLAAAALGVLGLLLVVGTVAAGLFTRGGRGDPLLWLLAGSTGAGIGALLLFVQVGHSHTYFFRLSTIAAGLAVACAAAHLSTRTDAARPMVVGIASGVAAGVLAATAANAGADTTLWGAWLAVAGTVSFVVLVSATVLRGRGREAIVLASLMGLVAAATIGPLARVARFDLPPRGVADERVAPHWVHSGEVRVLRWLRDHSDPDDLVATNRHCRGKAGPRCESRRFDVAAYSERRVLVEGWAYTPKADAQYAATGDRWGPFWDTDLLETNDRFFTEPDAAGRAALLDLGVRWLVVSDQAPHAPSLEPWAVLRERSPRMDIYELVPDAE